MKTRSIFAHVSAGVALAFLSFGISNSHAASATPIQNADPGFLQASALQPVTWDRYKIEKLQHAYTLLEHADGDYAGHREAAMRSIKEAAGILGVDLTGLKEHAEESQWKSDKRLGEARRLLKELVIQGHGDEQPHVRRAIKELDKALATR